MTGLKYLEVTSKEVLSKIGLWQCSNQSKIKVSSAYYFSLVGSEDGKKDSWCHIQGKYWTIKIFDSYSNNNVIRKVHDVISRPIVSKNKSRGAGGISSWIIFPQSTHLLHF